MTVPHPAFRLLFYSLYPAKPTILDSIKWNNYPPSPQSNDEGAKEQEARHFGIIEMGGGVVQMSH